MKKILWLLLALALIGSAVGYYLYTKPVGGLENVSPDFRVDATSLFKEYDSNEQNADKKYLGKIIEVTGKVKSVAPTDSAKYNVTVKTEDEMGGVISCEVNSKINPEVKNLSGGNNIKIKGKCSGKLMDVVLVNCYIEKN